MAFDKFASLLNQIGHYWMSQRLCSKNSDQLPVLNRLTDIFAVSKFDYGVMVRYQNLTRKPELFRAPWARAPWASARVGCTPWIPLSEALITTTKWVRKLIPERSFAAPKTRVNALPEPPFVVLDYSCTGMRRVELWQNLLFWKCDCVSF